MAAIYNLEFTRVDTELSIYINSSLRIAKFVDQNLKINAKYQFYVEHGRPVHLSIVLYNGNIPEKRRSKHWEQPRVTFTLYKSGCKRPMAMVHDLWEDTGENQVHVKEYSYLLR